MAARRAAPHRTAHAKAVRAGGSGRGRAFKASKNGLVPIGRRIGPGGYSSTYWWNAHPARGSFGPYGFGPIYGW